MKKVLLLVAFLVTSVSLANASRPNGPLTYNPNNHGTIDDRYVEIDVFRDYISFSFDRSVSHVCVKNINTGKSFSRYFTPAMPCHLTILVLAGGFNAHHVVAVNLRQREGVTYA